METDAVSDAVARFGRWDDCEQLQKLWHRQQSPTREPGYPLAPPDAVYLDLGANIG